MIYSFGTRTTSRTRKDMPCRTLVSRGATGFIKRSSWMAAVLTPSHTPRRTEWLRTAPSHSLESTGR